MVNKIAWEKWQDDEHYIEASSNINHSIQSSDFDDIEIDDDDDDIESLMGMPIDVTIFPTMINTPLGQFSVLDPMLPSRQFDCWIGHTNFPITTKEFNIIDNEVNGVEAFRVISKYKFFIGIAKLFNFREVRQELSQKICHKNGETQMIDIEKEAIVEFMSREKDVKRWAVLLLKDGDIEYLTSKKEDDGEYDTKLEELKLRKDGHLITSE